MTCNVDPTGGTHRAECVKLKMKIFHETKEKGNLFSMQMVHQYALH